MSAAAEEAVEPGEESVRFDFDVSFQEKLLALMLCDSKFALRAKDLVEPSYFTEDAMGVLASILRDYTRAYKCAPDRTVITTVLKDEFAKRRLSDDHKQGVKDIIKKALSGKIDLSGSGFVMDKIAVFAKHQAITQAMVKAIDLLDKGNLDDIAKLMKPALNVGSVSGSVEYDYWEEIESRTQEREDWKAGKIVKSGITTGISEFDAHLYHGGWGRKELSLIMGAAKAGKTMSLGEFTRNASLRGYNTLYLSCEVACKIIAARVDAALSDTAVRLLKDDPQEIRRRIRAAQAKAGAFKLRDFPTGSLKPSEIHRLLEDYRSEGLMIDLLTVDYADIMAAEYRSDNMIDNMRSIYIDLRALAHEFDIAVLTATQTNREGAKKATASATDVAEDYNKIRTADVVLGINISEQERSDGEARVKWLASRNSEDGFILRIKQDREKMKFITAVMRRE